MTLQELREKLAKLQGEMRALINAADKESRAMTETETNEFDSKKQEVETLRSSIQRHEYMNEQQRSAPLIEQHGDGNFETRCRRDFNMLRAIAADIAPGSVDAGLETELSREAAQRDNRSPKGVYIPRQVFESETRAALLSSGGGGSLVPERHRDDMFINPLRDALQVAKAGATVMTGLTGDQDIPGMSSGGTAAWVGEHGEVPETEGVFKTVPMKPKTVGAYYEISRRMLINANPDIDKLVRNDLAAAIAKAIDKKAIAGDGTNNTPIGVLNAAGVKTYPFSDGTSYTFKDILKIIEQVTMDNALGGSLAWMACPSFVTNTRSVSRLVGGTDLAMMEKPDELANYPLYQSNHIPKDMGANTDEAPLIFGNWADMLIGYWSGVDVLVNPYHASIYNKGGVLINAMQDVDVTVRHSESFVFSTGIAA